MAHRPNPGLQRFLVLTILGLITVKFLVIGIIGVKPPSLHDGDSVSGLKGKAGFDEMISRKDRQAKLEDMLAPTPKLNWANPNEGFNLSEQSALIKPMDEPNADGPSEEAAPVLGAEIRVAPVYFQQLPDLSSLDSNQRKDRFISYMLPLLLKANDEVRQRQKLIHTTIADHNRERLEKWAELYGIEVTGKDFDAIALILKRRVRTVPISLALAQAAVESGWGTSRFVTEGNALFGQWAWSLDAGIRPEEPRYENAVVRSFPTLFDSVRAYVHNLNTHYAYSDFRLKRLGISSPPTPDEIDDLIDGLHPYSEEGEKYIKTLRLIIASNDLWIYDKAVLETK